MRHDLRSTIVPDDLAVLPSRVEATTAGRWFAHAVIAVLVVALAACGDEPDRTILSDDGASDSSGSVSPAAPEWVALPDAPIPPRDRALVVAVGDQVAVFGGTTFLCHPAAGCVAPRDDPRLTDGAIHDLDTGTWRPMAETPVPVQAFEAAAVAVGGAVIVVTATWSEESAVLLRYDPTTDAWTTVVEGIEGGTPVVVDDHHVLLFSTSDERGEVPDRFVDLTTGSVTPLPPDPLGPSFDRQAVVADEAVVLFAKSMDATSDSSNPNFLTVTRFDRRTQAWSEPATTGQLASYNPWLFHDGRLLSPSTGCADGGRTNGWDACHPYGGAVDPATLAWSELPQPPADDRRFERPVPAIGATMSTWPVGAWAVEAGWAWDAVADQYVAFPALPTDRSPDEPHASRSIHPVGADGFVFGGARFPADNPNGELLGDAWLLRSRPTS